MLDTRMASFQTTNRRRKCLQCGYVFVTTEVHSGVLTTAKLKSVQGRVQRVIKTRKQDIHIANQLYLGYAKLVAEFKMDKSSIFRAARRGKRYIKEHGDELCRRY